MHLAGTICQGASHTHLNELLSEREGIHIGRTTLRRILADAGMASPRGRPPTKHRVRSERTAREGMLIQLDGSHHHWLGEGGPQFALLFAEDYATGAVVDALFCGQEDSLSYFRLFQGLIQRRGLPLALYTDRHPVFKHRSEHQPAGTATQFGRAMAELGVQLIFVLFPQAKGCVERTAGTFQDRLITELRLMGAATLEEAKAVLKQFLPASPALWRSAQCRSLPFSIGFRSRPGADPCLSPPVACQRQHPQVPQAHPANIVRPTPPQAPATRGRW